MPRANIYSIEKLPANHESTILQGMDIVSGYIGRKIIANITRVVLPLKPNGNVDPKRVGYGKLDKLVELHLFAVPMDMGDDEKLGIGFLGAGIAYVDTKRDDSIIGSTTSHEIAHALGFVSSGASHEDRLSAYHCANRVCVMHKKLIITEEATERRSKGLKGYLEKTGMIMSQGIYDFSYSHQKDFCSDCQKEMQELSAFNIAQLRNNRLATGRIGIAPVK